jgi:hypothetical protein
MSKQGFLFFGYFKSIIKTIRIFRRRTSWAKGGGKQEGFLVFGLS